MNKSNYALISVLYDTEGADLYNDIYFPIIKYGIVSLYREQDDIQEYYDLGNLQSTINDSFGISIPLIVLKQAIKAVYRHNSDISIELYGNGNQFKIKKAWNIEVTESIGNQYEDILIKFDQLDKFFANYLKLEMVESDKTFLDFLTDNTEEIFDYIAAGVAAPRLDGSYVHIMRFLKWVNARNIELYNIANNIFWGSVIAAFLQRDIDLSIKPATSVEYFFDSSLVLAVLDLDNESNVSYARELVNIIMASGNVPKVHSLTLREIKSILFSLEQSQVPKPSSGIAEAYYRRELTPSKVLQIRNELQRLVSREGLYIEYATDKALDDIQTAYRTKPLVNELKEQRGYTASDNIRDIHDVYMNDFIAEKRGRVLSVEKCNAYFVSLNLELIDFHKQHTHRKSFPSVIHPSRIVSDLWIHNSKCTLLKENALAETMSRCIALSHIDARRKLKLISKYFNDDNYSEEKYNALFLALLDRSRRVLEEVNGLDTEDDPKKAEMRFNEAVKIAVEEALRKKEGNAELKARLDELDKSIRQDEARNKQEEETKNRQIEKLKYELSQKSRLIEITRLIHETDSELSKLERQKQKSVCMFKFHLVLICEILCVLLLTGSVAFLLYNVMTGRTDAAFFKNNIIAVITLLASGIFTASRLRSLYMLSPRINRNAIRAEQVRHWEERTPEYGRLTEEKCRLSEEKNMIERSSGSHP